MLYVDETGHLTSSGITEETMAAMEAEGDDNTRDMLLGEVAKKQPIIDANSRLDPAFIGSGNVTLANFDALAGAATGTSSVLASSSYVESAIEAAVDDLQGDAAPFMKTLGHISDAIGDNPSFYVAVNDGIDTRQLKFSANNRLNADLIGTGNVNNEEYDCLNGIKSNIQTQLNGKQASIGGANPRLSALLIGSGGLVNNDALKHLSGIQGNIQAQLNSKLNADTNVPATMIGDGTVTDDAFACLQDVDEKIQDHMQRISGELDEKQDTITLAAPLDAEFIGAGTVNNTEYGHLSNASSSIQTQLDDRQNLSDLSTALFDTVLFDTTPTEGSDNLVQSDDLYTAFTVPPVVPPQGAKGETGVQGPKGDTGPVGEPGEPGDDGVEGDRGEQGVKGDPGEPGGRGDQGEQGEQGDQGFRGLDGDQGAKGERGETGINGVAGDDGPAGPDGFQGVEGERGVQGDVGDKGLTGFDGHIGLVGNEGEKGESGTKGVVGDRGDQGDQGDQGAANTDTGLRGDKGGQGLQGDEGDPGVLKEPSPWQRLHVQAAILATVISLPDTRETIVTYPTGVNNIDVDMPAATLPEKYGPDIPVEYYPSHGLRYINGSGPHRFEKDGYKENFYHVYMLPQLYNTEANGSHPLVYGKPAAVSVGEVGVAAYLYSYQNGVIVPNTQ